MIFILEVVKVVFEILSQRKYCGLPVCKCGSAKRKNKTAKQKFEMEWICNLMRCEAQKLFETKITLTSCN